MAPIWIKVACEFPEHWKVMCAGERLGPFGSGRILAVWLEGMGYTNKVGTRGFLPRVNVSRFVHDRDPLAVANAMAAPLTDAEAAQWGVPLVTDESRTMLWIPVSGGWRVHDYMDYQGKAVELSAKRSAAGKLGGQASAAARRANQANHQAPREAIATADGRANRQLSGSIRFEASQANPNAVTGTSCSFGATSTARLAPSDVQQPVEKSKPASPWKRAVAVVHQVMDDLPDRADWTEEVKMRCALQRIPYGQPGGNDQRPLYVRAMDYVEEVRRRRRVG